jgi:hypothetical protein
VYTLKNLTAPSLDVGNTFVVCDAGGGTVDLISYEIVRRYPKLEIKEAAGGTGGKCGSSLLNKRFRRYLKQEFGEAYWREHTRLAEALDEFERVNLYLTVPQSVDLHLHKIVQKAVYTNRRAADFTH